jgi:glycosyltransferase involved in cell wall biosynthesis
MLEVVVMKPLVSILIPAYNSGDWIADTLRSALSQSWPNKEIIVVDDGSKDSTLDIARQFASEGVKVFTQKNQGAAAARNAAYQYCRGDYIQWLDADDLLSRDKISTQMAKAEEAGNRRVLISCGWSQFLYRYYRADFKPTALWRDHLPVDWLICKMGQDLHMQTATWLVSRELCEAAGPWDTTLLGDDDGEYFCRVLLASDGVRFTPEARVYYRASGAGSLSYIGSSNQKRDAQWRSMKLHMGYLRSLEDSPRTRAACVSYIQNWLVFFYPDRPDLIEQMRQTAQELGGAIRTPRLSWKYSWIEFLFGEKLGRRAQFVLPKFKWEMLRHGDRLLFRLANGASSPLRTG